MKKKLLVVFVAAAALLLTAAVVGANGKSDIAQVKSATVRFHRTENAQAAGWDLRDGFDHCFDNQPVGGMGYHYIRYS